MKETHAVALFPGGFGTLDEGFEALTLMQTGKALIIPIVLIDRPNGSYWESWMRFLTDHLLKQGLDLGGATSTSSKSCTTSRKRSEKFSSSIETTTRRAGLDRS